MNTACRSLPRSSWPTHDRVAWDHATTGDFLQSPRPASWRAGTKRTAAAAYGTWLKWFEEQGRLVDESPESRATAENMKQFAKAQLGRGLALGTIARRVSLVTSLLAGMCPLADLTEVRRVRNRLLRAADRGAVPRGSIVHAGRLYQHGLQLMAAAKESGISNPVVGSTYVDGLIIALLAACPMRLQTFCSLRLGIEVVRGEDRWQVLVDGSLTKSGEPELRLVPASLTQVLDCYVHLVRPVLLAIGRGPGGPALLIGRRGEPLQGQVVRKRIIARTKAAFGKRILPHDFRKAAITTLVMEFPEHAVSAPLLLTHTGTKTAEKHYVIRQQLLAQRHYHRALKEAAGRRSREEVRG